MKYIMRMLKYDADAGMSCVRESFQTFINHVSLQDFDVPGLAETYGLDTTEFREGMIRTAKRVAAISDQDLDALTDELSEMYPMDIAVFYEMCIRAMQKHMKEFDV